MEQDSSRTLGGAGVSWLACHSNSSGNANTIEPTHTTASLARMDWHDSNRWALGCMLVAAWKRSMAKAHRLKVVTPWEDTWTEQGEF